MQKFYAHPTNTFKSPNGAIGHRTGESPFDILGAYAKVRNCPVIVAGEEVARLTCYATGYADSFFSIPACTRYKGKYVGGYFTSGEGGTEFRVYNRFLERMGFVERIGKPYA
jgi:hypothetical protein